MWVRRLDPGEGIQIGIGSLVYVSAGNPRSMALAIDAPKDVLLSSDVVRLDYDGGFQVIALRPGEGIGLGGLAMIYASSDNPHKMSIAIDPLPDIEIVKLAHKIGG